MAALTTANGVNMTKRAALNANTGSLTDLMDGANQVGTKLRMCYDTYEFDGDTMDATGVITIGAVPKGARVFGWYCSAAAASVAVTADFQLVDAAGNITTASAAEVWTTWNGVTQFFVPALEAVSNDALDAEHTVTITTLAATIPDGLSLVVVTFYLVED
ncbi:hypothetical protein LCGC14_2670010 [marine sediment metagenome]|uniref:Uncharacterized protein n=1 Tax=marine sediment metagenome TaxID=412755 RepID=A0A0F8ZPE0_9ZZZZ